MLRLPKSWATRFKQEGGSVTAELALAMPAITLVLAITLGSFSLQIERMKLVDAAATAARSIARGEEQTQAQNLLGETLGSKSGHKLQISTRENFVCVEISKTYEIAGLGDSMFDLAEAQCARKMGL
jgi:hypothetical protein